MWLETPPYTHQTSPSPEEILEEDSQFEGQLLGTCCVTLHTHLVLLFSLSKCWLRPLLHQGPGECRKAEVILHDADNLPQEASQSSEVVLLACQKILEDSTEQLQVTSQ